MASSTGAQSGLARGLEDRRSFGELHLHLEGAVDAELLREIDKNVSDKEIADIWAFQDFASFLQSFKAVVLRLRDPEHFRLVARELFARLAQQGIVYAEVTHSLGVSLWRNLDAKAIAEALIEEGRTAPLAVHWIFDGVRQFSGDHLMATAKLAAAFAGEEVVAFGVGGDETGAAVADLRPAFAWARAAGLQLTAHAGETSSAQSVWEALSLGVARIGHGIRAIDDPKLVKELAARAIPLEISLTSNIRTGAVASLAEHPAKRLWDAGVPITLNTDDPSLFATNLLQEFAIAQEVLGFSEEDLERIRRNAFHFAFRAPKAVELDPPSR